MERILPFTSLLFQDSVSTPKMRKVWSEDNLLQKWMDVEIAITRSQAVLGMIPGEAAEEICSKLSLELLSAEKIARKKQAVGHVLVSFLKTFRELCGPAAEHFHLGPTTQDILDTGLTLMIRESHELILSEAVSLAETLCLRALRYKDTLVMGRTHQQHAVPTTFGFILAIWASEIADHIERAISSEDRWLFGNLSGIVGAQNSFVALSDIDTARKLQKMVCTKLGLRTPLIDLHTRLDRFSEIVANLCGLTGSLGKMGLNIRDWQRPEVMEVEEPYKDTYYSSTAAPHKQNPESSEIVEGLAVVSRGLSSAMQTLNMPVTRDSTRIPVEFTCIPQIYMMTARALEITRNNIAGLVVHADRMRYNVNHPNVLDQAASERLMMAIYKKTGEKDRAHTHLRDLAVESNKNRLPFKRVLSRDNQITSIFSLEELAELMDLSTYTGTAAHQTAEAVCIIRNKLKLYSR